MADASTRLCIPAFEGHHGEVYIFKTPHHPDYRIDGAVEITTVAQATSAAPSYFRAVEEAGYRFVDGGVWANNPVMIGVVDALACFAISPPQLSILSLGYGRDPFRVNRARSVGGQWAWRKVIYAAMELQSQNALGQAGLLIGPENMTRLEPQLSRPIALDDWRRSSRELPPLAAELIEKCGSQIADRFLGRPAERAQFFWPPVARSGSPHLAPAVA
jgi:hypothetical protein